MIARGAAALALLGGLAGCSGPCTSAGVEGSYSLSAKGVSYALELRAGGTGALSASGKVVGDLRWALSNTSDQQIVELDASGPVYAALSGIAPKKDGSVSAVVVSSGVIAPAPECTRAGRMAKLVLDFDEGIAFKRTGG